jgi:carboxyl-terminal processing protease
MLKGDKLIRILVGVAAILVIGIVGAGSFMIGRETASSSSASASDSEYDFSVLNEMIDILGDDYVRPDNIDQQSLFEAAVNGMLGILNDDGTFYVNAEDNELDTTLTGSFEGIGATVSSQNNEIVIVSTFRDTAAEKAGLQSGDVILKVDGVDTRGWTSQKAALTIRGPKGTEVVLSIRHPDGDEQEYKLIRSTVQVSTVFTSPPGGVLRTSAGQQVNNLGYIQIDEFSRRTAQELDDALKAHIANGVQGLIIDVRNNGGGLLSTTLSAVDLFLDRGTIVIQRDGDGRERTYSANNGQSAANLPVVVLQNRFSASASEILAAALRDNGRATIVGEKSFGKGTVNTARDLDNGAALYVSIAHWLTPGGALIDKVGVRPDVEIIPTDEDIDLRRDPQLVRAVDMLLAQGRTP